MGLPEPGQLNVLVDRSEESKQIELFLRSEDVPLNAERRQWAMEFWDEARETLYATAIANVAETQVNQVRLVFDGSELGSLPDHFRGDLLVVFQNGRRRYLLTVQGEAVGEALVPYPPPPYEVDPHFGSVSLLLYFQGPDGSANIIDSALTSISTITRVGAVISNDVELVPGATGLKVASAGHYLRLNDVNPISFGTSNFCLEFTCDIRTNTGNGEPVLMSTSPMTAGNNGFRIRVDGPSTSWGGTGKITFEGPAGSGIPTLTSTSNVRNSGRRFIAVARWESSWGLFVDGNLEATANAAGVTIGGLSTSGNIFAGTLSNGSADTGNSSWEIGYLGPLRATKGQPRYTDSYTPYNAVFPGRSLLGASQAYRYWRFDQMGIVGSVLEIGEWGLFASGQLCSTRRWIDRGLVDNSGLIYNTAMIDGVTNVRCFQLTAKMAADSLVFDAGVPIRPDQFGYSTWFQPSGRHIDTIRLSASNDDVAYTPLIVFTGMDAGYAGSAGMRYYDLPSYVE